MVTVVFLFFLHTTYHMIHYLFPIPKRKKSWKFIARDLFLVVNCQTGLIKRKRSCSYQIWLASSTQIDDTQRTHGRTLHRQNKDIRHTEKTHARVEYIQKNGRTYRIYARMDGTQKTGTHGIHICITNHVWLSGAQSSYPSKSYPRRFGSSPLKDAKRKTQMLEIFRFPQNYGSFQFRL